MKVILIGFGTLSKLVLDILSYKDDFQVAGIYDDTYEAGTIVNGYRILGKVEEVYGSITKNAIICIGEPKIRKIIYDNLKLHNFNLPNIIAHNAIISSNSSIGDGCIVGFFSSILHSSNIEDGVCMLNYVSINHNTQVNKFALIGVGVFIGNDSILGEGTHIGMGVTICPGAKVDSWKYINDNLIQ